MSTAIAHLVIFGLGFCAGLLVTVRGLLVAAALPDDSENHQSEMNSPFIKSAVVPGVDLDAATLEVQVVAHPTTLRELQTIMLIEANKKGIPYVHEETEA